MRQPIDIESEYDANHPVDVDHTGYDGPVAFENYLDGADPDATRRCRKEARTGSRLKLMVCGVLPYHCS